ncbi:MAG: Hpt domain-containing protein [Caulobacteraceae bacterium]
MKPTSTLCSPGATSAQALGKAELIDPRDKGLRTLDLKKPLFDAGAVARANEALEAMGDDMQAWLEADVERLQAARLRADAAGWHASSQEDVHGIAHDLKGLGGTYGSMFATRVAASLCRLIETDAGKALAQRDPSLARTHVDALRAAVRDGVTSLDDPMGRAVLHALETRVAALGVAPG